MAEGVRGRLLLASSLQCFVGNIYVETAASSNHYVKDLPTKIHQTFLTYSFIYIFWGVILRKLMDLEYIS